MVGKAGFDRAIGAVERRDLQALLREINGIAPAAAAEFEQPRAFLESWRAGDREWRRRLRLEPSVEAVPMFAAAIIDPGAAELPLERIDHAKRGIVRVDRAEVIDHDRAACRFGVTLHAGHAVAVYALGAAVASHALFQRDPQVEFEAIGNVLVEPLARLLEHRHRRDDDDYAL